MSDVLVSVTLNSLPRAQYDALKAKTAIYALEENGDASQNFLIEEPQKAWQQAHLARQFISMMHRRDCCAIAYPRNGGCEGRDHEDSAVHFTAS